MMASQQSSITSISPPTNLEPIPPPRCTTSTGKRTSNANPTVSTPAPVLTDAVQKCVDTAAEAIVTHREAKLVFMQGLVKRILREAYREPTIPPSAGTPLARVSLLGFLHPVEDHLPLLLHIPITKMDNFIIITLLKILSQNPNLLLLQLIQPHLILQE